MPTAQKEEERLCLCGCQQPVDTRGRKRGNRYVKGHYPPQKKPVPVAQPCACGCGVMTKPGSKFRAGHWKRARGQQQRSQSVLSVEQIEAGLQQPLVSRCARCGFAYAGTASDALAEFKAHRKTCIANTEAVTA